MSQRDGQGVGQRTHGEGPRGKSATGNRQLEGQVQYRGNKQPRGVWGGGAPPSQRKPETAQSRVLSLMGYELMGYELLATS